MKRVGYIYERMAQWENLVAAENASTRRKTRNPGVARHIASRWKNLTEIQRMILEGRMRTGEYRHEPRVSGQNKLRDIAKLHFHPSHIEHQSLTMAGERRIEKALTDQTYASRKGYGQIACALRIRKNLAKYRGGERWYGQGDVRKYYQHIRHDLVRKALERLFKDKKFIDAYMEPFGRFAPEGVGIPLGIRPSQSVGNLALCAFDHYMQETVKAEDYVRYLDDFLFTGATKGEVRRKMRTAEAYLGELGLELHVPKIHRVSEGVDMMGYVFYGYRSDMWWRKADKVRWLKRRAKVTNRRRLKEIDDAAWGMLSWGNGHCRRMWEKVTGRKARDKRMGVNFGKCGIRRTERTDAKGTPFIDAPKIGMQMLLGKPVECLRWLGGISTSHGDGRYAVLVRFMGGEYKLIVNSADIKCLLEDMARNGVTKFRTVFTDKGQLHYGADLSQTEVLEVGGRKVEELDGKAVYSDTKEEVLFN